MLTPPHPHTHHHPNPQPQPQPSCLVPSLRRDHRLSVRLIECKLASLSSDIDTYATVRFYVAAPSTSGTSPNFPSNSGHLLNYSGVELSAANATLCPPSALPPQPPPLQQQSLTPLLPHSPQSASPSSSVGSGGSNQSAYASSISQNQARPPIVSGGGTLPATPVASAVPSTPISVAFAAAVSGYGPPITVFAPQSNLATSTAYTAAFPPVLAIPLPLFMGAASSGAYDAGAFALNLPSSHSSSSAAASAPSAVPSSCTIDVFFYTFFILFIITPRH